MNRSLAACLIAAAGMLALSSAGAAATCGVQSAGIAFGAYDTLDPSPLDGAGSIVVDCDSPTPFTVDLGAGGGSFDQRAMAGGASGLDYNLYTDPSRTIVWGDGVSGSDVSGSGTSVTLPVYGRIPARQEVPAGSYSDTVSVTISY